jgi:DNA-binding transcriptional LysR family regulator
MSQITLDRLRYFVEVANLQHVNKAAKNLAVSASVISSAISTLEDDFGCKFFFRDKNRISLNEKGLLLLEKAKIILEETSNLYFSVANESFKMRGHFKISASHFLLQKYVIPCFLKIQNSNPDLSVEFIALDTGAATSKVIAGEIDVALVFRSISTLEVEEAVLCDGNFQIVVKSNHPILKIPKSERIQKLNSLPAITFKPTVGLNFVKNHPAFEALGLVPKHCYFYEDHQTVFQLLQKTSGWAFLPSVMVENNKTITRVSVTSSFRAPVRISLISSKNKVSSYLVKKMEEELRSCF